MLKVAQHKSLRQVQQEALQALGDDKESVGDTELEGLIRLRDFIEQCLKTFKNKLLDLRYLLDNICAFLQCVLVC